MTIDTVVIHGIGRDAAFAQADIDFYAKRLHISPDRLLLFDYGAALDAPSAFRGVLEKLLWRAVYNDIGDKVADIATYFASPSGGEIVATFANTLLGLLLQERPITVVAHSLGTVVAWQACQLLHQIESMHGQQPLAPLNLILMGSPMAMRLVRFRVGPAKITGHVAQNLAGVYDPVCLFGAQWPHGGGHKLLKQGHSLELYLDCARGYL